jgi:hypothetical protein
MKTKKAKTKTEEPKEEKMETAKIILGGVRIHFQVFAVKDGKPNTPQLIPDEMFVPASNLNNINEVVGEAFKELCKKYKLEEAEIK